MKSYVIGRLPYYRDGRFYEEGEVVTIPAKEKPHPSWETASAEKPRRPRRNTAKVEEIADEVEAEPEEVADRASDRSL